MIYLDKTVTEELRHLSAAFDSPFTITIDVAKKQFQNWRNTKSPGDRMPDELWAIVGQILANPTYKKSIVGHELGISTTQLRGKFPERFPPRNKPIAAH